MKKKKMPACHPSTWELIAQAKKNFKKWQSQLPELEDEVLKNFLFDYRFLLDFLGDDEFQQACAAVRGHPSEDDARDISEWVVMQGKEFYHMIREDNYKLPKKADYSADYNLAYYSAAKEHEKRFGEMYPPIEDDPMHFFRYERKWW